MLLAKKIPCCLGGRGHLWILGNTVPTALTGILSGVTPNYILQLQSLGNWLTFSLTPEHPAMEGTQRQGHLRVYDAL